MSNKNSFVQWHSLNILVLLYKKREKKCRLFAVANIRSNVSFTEDQFERIAHPQFSRKLMPHCLWKPKSPSELRKQDTSILLINDILWKTDFSMIDWKSAIYRNAIPAFSIWCFNLEFIFSFPNKLYCSACNMHWGFRARLPARAQKSKKDINF